MKTPARIILVLLLVMVTGVGLVFMRARGGPDQLPTGRLHDYQLDPPGLADLELGDVQPGVPVLCYHYFRSSFDAPYLLKVLGSVFFGLPALGDREFWTTPVGEFERHLKYFAETNTRVMTLDEVSNMLDSGQPLPSRAVVLTIDDADLSVYEQAWPLLKKYNVQAHLFVPTAMVGTRWSSLNVCSWEQLKEMSDSGHIIVDSHTRHLHYKIATSESPEPVFLHPESIEDDVVQDNRNRIAQFSTDQWQLINAQQISHILKKPHPAIAEDLLASRLDILNGVGKAPRWLSWPYGFADDRRDSLASSLGFAGTVSLRPSTYGPGESPWHVGRFTLTAKTTIDRISLVFPDNSQ